MPADDVLIQVRQITQYPPKTTVAASDAVLLQSGGIGGPYYYAAAADLVATALAMSPETLTAQSIEAGTIANSVFNGGAINGSQFVGGTFKGVSGSFDALDIGGLPAATQAYADSGDANLTGLYANATVWTFNNRSGSVILFLNDILGAGGAPICSPQFLGQPTAATPPPGDNSINLATTAFVQNAILNQQEPGLAPLDSPAFTGVPTAPTAPPGTSTGQIATTAFVENAIVASTSGVASFNARTGAVTLSALDIGAAGGALANNAALTGVPTAPTATLGTNTPQIATTAFVQAALPASLVSTFNTRTGAITLTSADITAAGGALASGAVASFNARTGAVTFQANDLSAVGGAMLASPAFTGVPTGPTAVLGTNSAQLATTAFVENAIGGVNAGVITFNGRVGDVLLTSADVTGAGGAPLANPVFTGQVTPGLGVKGATDASSAPAGCVGEFLTATVSTSNVGLSNNVAANAVTLALTAGDWNVWGVLSLSLGSGGATSVNSGLNTVSLILPPQNVAGFGLAASLPPSSPCFPVPQQRINVAGGTTVYLVVEAAFPSGSCTAGGSIFARRVR